LGTRSRPRSRHASLPLRLRWPPAPSRLAFLLREQRARPPALRARRLHRRGPPPRARLHRGTLGRRDRPRALARRAARVTAGRPSWTAQVMALFRAIESARPQASRLFDDPFARAFLGLPFRAVAAAASLPGGADAITWVIERRWGGPLGAGVCRTRFVDDA